MKRHLSTLLTSMNFGRVFSNTCHYSLQCGTYSELLANSGAFAEFLQTYASENQSSNTTGNMHFQTGYKEFNI